MAAVAYHRGPFVMRTRFSAKRSPTPSDSGIWRPIHRSQPILRRLGLRDRGNFRRGTRSSFGNSSILCGTIGSMRPSTLRLRQACAGVKCLDSAGATLISRLSSSPLSSA